MDPGRLYLNLAGREPGGIVPPAEYEGVRDELRRWAEALPFVQRVATREEAFSGPARRAAHPTSCWCRRTAGI